MTTKVNTNQDERLTKSAATADRGSRSAEDVRRQDNDGTATTVSERRKMFKNEWTQEALPNPPAIPGFHLCWLSTTSSYDSIHKRVRMGYVPVKVEEVDGFETYRMKGGEFDGFVAVNEMILFKLPNEIYNELMQELHHHAPNDEEGKLAEIASQGQTDSNGTPLGSIEGDGFNTLGSKKRTPNFI